MRHPDTLQHSAWKLAVKRWMDVLVSFLVLTLIWPFLLVVALAIRVSSPGPIFYRGVRAGLHGKPFRILKFRTMVQDAESLGGPTTGTNDFRVTPIGRVLRRTKLDELPQFMNVLVGEMSLVGPRPEVLKYTNKYEGEQLLILSMRPGITDHASIEFADLDDRVGNENPDEYFRQKILPHKNKMRLDYVKTWSLRGDFRILCKTFIRILRRSSKHDGMGSCQLLE